MKQFIFSTLLSLVCCCVNAQPKNAYCLTLNHRGAGEMTVVDTTCICVWYAFNADNVKDVNTYIDQQRLDIGKRVTKYYSDFLFRSDSLIDAWKKTHTGARTVPRFFGNGGKKPDRWSEYEYSDLFISSGMVTVYASMPQGLEKYNAYYTEAYPLQQWKMGAEMQTILGHRCQNATCQWRGRDYVAWFATDIPVKFGPWKFGGLPGLILKLQDTEGVYRWEAVQISSKPRSIFKYDFKNYHVSTYEKVWKQQKAFNENWFKATNYHKASIDAAGNMVQGEAVSKYTPYSPLELE
jgi:GLPGLI family protein